MDLCIRGGYLICSLDSVGVILHVPYSPVQRVNAIALMLSRATHPMVHPHTRGDEMDVLFSIK